MTLRVFDPVAMGQASIVLSVIGDEEIQVMGRSLTATKISLSVQRLYPAGLDRRQRGHPQGNRHAGYQPGESHPGRSHVRAAGPPSQDLTEMASIPANIDIRNPEAFSLLKAEITGITDETVNLHGGRQPLWTASHRTPGTHGKTSHRISTGKIRRWSKNPYLEASPFIQSNHPAIIKLATDSPGKRFPP